MGLTGECYLGTITRGYAEDACETIVTRQAALGQLNTLNNIKAVTQ